MSNSNFDKNGLDNSGTHWLQYAAFVVTSFIFILAWHFPMMLISTISLLKYSSPGIAMDITLKFIT